MPLDSKRFVSVINISHEVCKLYISLLCQNYVSNEFSREFDVITLRNLVIKARDLNDNFMQKKYNYNKLTVKI